MLRHSAHKPITAVVVGAGARGTGHANYALQHPDELKIVAVAEPDAQRRESFAKIHNITDRMQFESYEQLATRASVANAAINCTNDSDHYDSSLVLLNAGYHLLLEKPIAQYEKHVQKIIELAKNRQRIVMVCHVLRYAPLYQRIKQIVNEGKIGSIVAINSSENISYHHMASAYVRGKWNRRETSNPIMMAKCCHDLDIITWLMAPHEAIRVASFGACSQFKSENAPAGSALRCLNGCEIEATCPYSAKLNYVDTNRWKEYVWGATEAAQQQSDEFKLDSLRKDNPYGRCVWHCDNNVMDHQTVIIQFSNGATCSHDLFCATTRPTRTIHILGSAGEILGDLEEGRISLRNPSTNAQQQDVEKIFDTSAHRNHNVAHGGGDERLLADFIAILRGASNSERLTDIEQSLQSHLIAFAADDAMRNNQVVELPDRHAGTRKDKVVIPSPVVTKV